MPRKIQEGIFFNKMSEFKKHGNHTYAILFLRVSKGQNAQQVFHSLKKIWDLYELLKKGTIVTIPDRVPSGGISVLIGYGSEIFNTPDVNKTIPRDFDGKQFLPVVEGSPILDGCGINYSKHSENVGISEHIAIQFVSNTQLSTYRAVVETWNHLIRMNKDEKCLQLTKYYTGFQRDDGRSWLGFHDEISNMKDVMERKGAISINKKSNQLKPDDYWTESGTYMAFLRTEINLTVWNKVTRKNQEFIVGRDKKTGSPIIGIDSSGKPIPAKDYCYPIITKLYDPKYHEHPDYLRKSYLIHAKVKDLKASRALLSQSHIGRTRHISNVNSKDPTSRRIYRQGFEFVDYQPSVGKPIRVGQNFVSFQNDPKRLIFILTDPRWMGKTNFGGSPSLFGGNLLSILSAGMFFVPAKEKPFPGACIFI